LAGDLVGASFGEIEEFALDVQRRHVLTAPDSDPEALLRERLTQWRARYAPSPERNQKRR